MSHKKKIQLLSFAGDTLVAAPKDPIPFPPPLPAPELSINPIAPESSSSSIESLEPKYFDVVVVVSNESDPSMSVSRPSSAAFGKDSLGSDVCDEEGFDTVGSPDSGSATASGLGTVVGTITGDDDALGALVEVDTVGSAGAIVVTCDGVTIGVGIEVGVGVAFGVGIGVGVDVGVGFGVGVDVGVGFGVGVEVGVGVGVGTLRSALAELTLTLFSVGEDVTSWKPMPSILALEEIVELYSSGVTISLPEESI